MLFICDVGEDLRVPWTGRRSNQSTLKEITSWIFIGRTDAEAETPILWPPDVKNWLTGKDPMLRTIKGRRRRGQQRMRWLDGIINSINTSLSKLGDSKGKGSLACCSPWGCKDSDTTEWLNNNNHDGIFSLTFLSPI